VRIGQANKAALPAVVVYGESFKNKRLAARLNCVK